jgi:hypothetical protein
MPRALPADHDDDACRHTRRHPSAAANRDSIRCPNRSRVALTGLSISKSKTRNPQSVLRSPPGRLVHAPHGLCHTNRTKSKLELHRIRVSESEGNDDEKRRPQGHLAVVLTLLGKRPLLCMRVDPLNLSPCPVAAVNATASFSSDL